ncbi:MAG TPA: hypothetical protein VFS77_07740, partial [Pyrinomonadaceae bacterium]|nr:hypothetical protein [Pyrinomonadaceae bacterium]
MNKVDLMPEASETAPPAPGTPAPGTPATDTPAETTQNEALRFSAVATGQKFEVPVLALQNLNLF